MCCGNAWVQSRSVCSALRCAQRAIALDTGMQQSRRLRIEAAVRRRSQCAGGFLMSRCAARHLTRLWQQCHVNASDRWRHEPCCTTAPAVSPLQACALSHHRGCIEAIPATSAAQRLPPLSSSPNPTADVKRAHRQAWPGPATRTVAAAPRFKSLPEHGIEPWTSALQVLRSTTELHRPRNDD